MSKTDIGFGPDWLKPKPKPSSQTSQPDLFQSASPVVSSSPFTLPPSSQYGSGQNSNSGSVSGNVTVNGGTPKAAKFRPHLAKNRYGREDMLALYHCVVDPDTSTIERPDGDEFLISDNNPWLTSKGFHEPINLQPFNEQDQRAFQQGINSPLCLRQFSNINTNDPNIHVVGGGQGSFGPGSRQGSVQDGNYEDRIGRGMDQRKIKKDRPGKPGILDGPPEVTDRRGRGMGSVSSMSQSMNDADWAGMQSGNTTPAEGENSFFTGKKPGGAVPGGKGGRLTRSDHTDWRKPRAKDEAPRHPWRRPGAPDEKPGDMGAPPGSSGRTSPRLGRQGSVPEKAVGGKGSRRLSQDKWSDMAEPAPNRRRDRNMPLWMDDDDPDFDPSASQMPELTEKEMRGING